ncbi:MAG: tetratricopeptide repeat protein [Bradymonadales bacterium]|nr:tetratricopeptide repeat protein [Bradymonadales bacterium]
MTDKERTTEELAPAEPEETAEGALANEVTRVYGRRTCPACQYDNQAKNEFCFNCGTPLGNVPEIVRRTSLSEESRASWRVYGIETTTAGREEELRQLTSRFEQVIAKRQFAAMLVVGPDGIGKSRLIDEFSRLINTAFGNALLVASAWYEGSEATYAIIDRLIRSRMYIPHTLAEQEARQRLLEGIRAVVKDPSAVEIAHRVGRLIGLPFPEDTYGEDDASDAHRIASWRSVVELVRADAESNPLVLVMEDMHYAKEQSLDFIAFVARELKDCPVMYLLSSTEESTRLLNDPLKQIPGLEEIQLKALGDEEIRSLVRQVLRRVETIPEVVFQRVCTNSLGNPLIAEEILRILIAEGAIDILGPKWRIQAERIADIPIPSGLVEVVQANLARLSEQERQLLEDAALVGDLFWKGPLLLIRSNLEADEVDREFPWKQTEQLEETIMELLSRLVDLDFIQRRDNRRYPDELEYTFKHSAVRRLLLEGLSPQRASRIHGLIAQWYELNRSRGITERDATIAHHHEMAGHLERAAYTYLAAGRRSRSNHHNRQAIDQFSRVIELLDDTHLLAKMEALHGIASVHELIGEYERSLEPLYQMLHYAWRAASLEKSGVAHDKLGGAYRSLGDLEQAMAHFDQALQLFRRANDKVGIASTIDDVGMVHSIRGHYAEALSMFREALNRRRELGDKRSMALSHSHMGSVYMLQGNVKEALIHLRESLTLRKEIGDKRGVAQSLNNLGVVLAERGNLEDALRLWQESAQVALEIGDRSLQCALFSNMGEVTCMLDRLDEAEVYLDRAIQLCARFAERRIGFDVTRNRAVLELKRGHVTKALEHAEEAMNLAQTLDSLVMEGIALRCIAQVQAHQLLGEEGEVQEIERVDQAFTRSIEILKEVGNDAELGRSYHAYGVFLAEQGMAEKARGNLGQAEQIFARLGMRSLLEKCRAVLAELED